jgi:hypothetical protein
MNSLSMHESHWMNSRSMPESHWMNSRWMPESRWMNSRWMKGFRISGEAEKGGIVGFPVSKSPLHFLRFRLRKRQNYLPKLTS